ncbi:MAG: 2-hydroxychromene-2-carboxylate isomerase [Polyangiaceae bacterium]|nr:2-hydroxychromene-2-carboxylate isomerase [Polyangiaceae bacterium]
MTLEFWFDYSCPYAYLAASAVEALAARARAELSWQPFLLGGVFRAVGTPQKLFATLSAQKAQHNARDLDRWADELGVTLRMPDAHPFRTVEALRATLLTGCDPRVIHGFYSAYWVGGRPVSAPDTLHDVLSAAGHDAASIVGRLGDARDELTRRTDRALAKGVFGAPALVVGDELFWGQDRLPFVERALTGARVELTPPTTRRPTVPHKLEVFFDFSSPFAYLGCSQVDAVAARTGCDVTWRPFLLGGLFKAIGQVDVPLNTWSEAKRLYTFKDMMRWAEHWGVPLRFPSRFPTNSLKALRLYLALPEARRDAYRGRVFTAYWAEDRDITDDGVLRELLGADADAAFARAQTPEVKDALKTATEDAAKRGVFGAPTFIVDGEELFWGQDRLGLVEARLRK